MEYCRDGTTHGNLYGLLDGMILGQEDGTLLKSEVVVFGGEVHISKLYLMIWVH